MRRGRGSGFTLIEVVLILLVVVLGVLGAVGLASFGMNLASRSQGASLGMATAISVANDRQQSLATTWTAPAALSIDAPSINDTTNGYVNGFYVTRTEISDSADIIAQSGGKVYARYCSVAVDVYDTLHGTVYASFNTQIVRQRGMP